MQGYHRNLNVFFYLNLLSCKGPILFRKTFQAKLIRSTVSSVFQTEIDIVVHMIM